jgi:hypothetical protein
MTQALGPVEVTFVLPIGGGGAPVPWRYLTANGHTADFVNAADVVVLSAGFGIDYNITPDGDTAPNAGTLTLLRAAPVTAAKLVLRRNTAKVQNYVATPGAEAIEKQLDRLTLVAQETEATTGGNTLSSLEALWLGPKTADPTLDNQGNTLLVGAVYFNTVALAMRVWNGTSWSNVSGAGSQPADDTLSAFAALVIAADKGIYGTGPDAFSLYDLTAFGRSMAGAADYLAGRTLLGLGDVAAFNKVTFALLDSSAVRILAGGFAGLNDIQLTTPAWVAGFLAQLGLNNLTRIVDAASVTGHNILNLAGWDEIEIVGRFDKAASSSPLLRVSTDNGATWLATGYLGGTSNEGSMSTVTNGLLLARDTSATTGFAFRAVLSQMAETGRSLLTGGNALPALSAETFHSHTPAGVINAVQLIGNGGNISNVTLTVRGLGKI